MPMCFLMCDKPTVNIAGLEYINMPVNMELCATFYPSTETERGNTVNVIKFISASNHRIATWRFESCEDRDMQMDKLTARVLCRV